MKQAEDHINEILAKYITGEKLSEQESNDIQKWIASHKQEYNRLVRLVSPQKIPVFDSHKAWKRIEQHIDRKDENSKTPIYDLNRKKWESHGMSLFYAAASIIVIAVISISFFMNSQNNKEQIFANNTATKKTVYLPDSSSVTLYPQAYLSYKTEGINSSREICLNGKAFFNVKKMQGRAFKVKSDNIMVEVLGTSFIVDATEAEKSCVYVKTGVVSVESKNSKVIIKTNQKAELKNDTLKTSKIENPYKVFDEQPKILSFINSGIIEVVEKIEQTTGIKIDVEKSLQNNNITSRIKTSDADDIVEELAFLCNCKFEVIEQGKHYRLYQ